MFKQVAHNPLQSEHMDPCKKVPGKQLLTQVDPHRMNPELHPVHSVAVLEQVAQVPAQFSQYPFPAIVIEN